MKVTKLDLVDWEPAQLTFLFNALTPSQIESFKDFVTGFLNKPRGVNCPCTLSFVEFFPDGFRKSIKMKSEWMCSRCVQLLADKVAAKYPKLRIVKLGISLVSTARGIKFINIPQREIRLENGRWYTVKPFSIARGLVTVGQYATFTKATEYLTDAERDGYFENFRSNQSVEGYGEQAREKAFARHFSFHDAATFCRHYGYRLPTEKEWLAAAIENWRGPEINDDDFYSLLMKPLPKDMIQIAGLEWTSTIAEDGVRIVRQGPERFLREDWMGAEMLSVHRKSCSEKTYKMSLGFRVVRPKKGT